LPKLPDYTALGSPTLPRATRGVSSYSTAGFTFALSRNPEGSELKKVGESLFKIGLEDKQNTDALQAVQTDADLTINENNLYQQHGQSEDYQNAPAQFREQALSQLSETANNIADPYRREVVQQRHRVAIESHALDLERHGTTRYHDDVKIQNEGRMDELARQALANPDPAFRTQMLQQAKDIIAVEQRAGVTTGAQAHARFRGFVEKYGGTLADEWIARDPAGAYEALKNVAPAKGVQLQQPGATPQITSEPQGQFTEGLADAVKKFEGYRPSAYPDFKQHSVGYGTRASSPNETIDRTTAETRLNFELSKAAAVVDSVNPNLPPGPRAALTSLTFNAGSDWTKQELGQRVAAGDIEGAKERFPLYNKAGGQENAALVARRAEELSWFDKGPPGSTKVSDEHKIITGTPIDFMRTDQVVEKLHKAEVALRSQTGDPPAKVSAMNTRQLFEKLLLPEGDPNKMTNRLQIDEAYLSSLKDPNGGISKADHDWLIGQWEKGKTEEGSSMQVMKKDLFDATKEIIEHQVNVENLTQANGKMKLLQFMRDADRKVEEYRKQGKDPRVLFDPGPSEKPNPEYLGRPENTQRYVKSLQQGMRDGADKQDYEVPYKFSPFPALQLWRQEALKQIEAAKTPQATMPAASTPQRPPVPMRRSGETITQYRQRVRVETISPPIGRLPNPQESELPRIQ
jgi:GH24 family phage-related lysozyme (muramidase)